jgi:hypothetical protein
MNRILYIASLPHSGSTLLDIFAGKHPDLIGLGGVDRAVGMLAMEPEKTAARMCSCGVEAGNCVYWGRVLERLRGGGDASGTAARYALALEVFGAVFGADKVLVDSTKLHEPLIALASMTPRPDVRVVHLAKDFRAAAVSFIENKRRKGAPSRPGWLLAIEGVWKWLRENRKIEDACGQARWPVLHLGYESLCLRPMDTMSALAAHAGVPDAAPADLNLRSTNSHLFIGNRMRREGTKAELHYDDRWMARTDWLPAAFLLPQVHAANRRWVHRTSSLSDLKPQAQCGSGVQCVKVVARPTSC